jgi:Protein of unknown function (DUF1549)/Protein of unknown function (DUF1553)/Planctomycete cytochrome C/NPCBM/NEW2 domain
MYRTNPHVLPWSIPGLLLVPMLLPTALAQDSTTLSEIERAARTLLRDRCIECHGETTQEGGLRLDHKDALVAGGDSGKAIQLGQSSESMLISRVSAKDDSRMPPNGSPLNSDQIETLKQFIDAQAPWTNAPLPDPKRDHWAWLPLSSPSPPPLNHTPADESNPIDRFLNAQLANEGIIPVAKANREVLIRRLYFDLLGLPPTPDEVEQFLTDTSHDAWERLVDRTLASPHYGERWARHWLDISHYADTHGFERDQRRDNAWRYRDWVIDALNKDLPYNQFIRDQIAGDVLPDATPESTIASSFLAVGPWDFVGQVETPSPVIKRLARADDLDDMLAQVMTSICGVTLHCARCHDHKLDPIQQQEYYSLAAIFSGVKRGDRIVSAEESSAIEHQKSDLKNRKQSIDQELSQLTHGLSLADIVGGGDGSGNGVPGQGIDPNSGNALAPNEKRGFLADVVPNRLNQPKNPWVDAVFIPDGGALRQLAISQSGIQAADIPATDSKAWDAIRNGPVNSQFSTSLNNVDYAPPGFSMLSLHANAGITFHLPYDKLLIAHKSAPQSANPSSEPTSFTFTSQVGYFGQTPKNGADVFVLLDGQIVFKYLGLGRDDGPQSIRIDLTKQDAYLTLIATDAGNSIGHDQVCFMNPSIASIQQSQSKAITERIAILREQSKQLQQELNQLPAPRRVYGVLTEPPTPIHRLHRGNAEDPREVVRPGVFSCVGPKLQELEQLDQHTPDAQRRLALATWLCSPGNPLPARVIANRLWHYHFGRGIVSTPSDFGLGGSLPSHPNLLDWLANQLIQSDWSIKRLHRLILLSEAYQRSSLGHENPAEAFDSANHFIWRQNPRRLDAESLRDTILFVSDAMVRNMHGPGYRDFDYQEEYAPVYKHRVFSTPDMFRRSIYRFVVRTTPHPFLTSLDCPNPATLTPVRNTTTTAIQALATLNNALILQQCSLFAQRLQREYPNNAELQSEQAICIALGRRATQVEIQSASQLIHDAGLPELCRVLFNTNEFIYVD